MKEKHYRSVVKGISWRMVGTMDTIFLSWLFTGSITSALKIGSIEVFTKIFLYYVHERIWLKLKYGREQVLNAEGVYIQKDKHYRSVVKGMSWRFFGTLDTIIIAFFVTGNHNTALSIGFTEVFTKVGLYYLHERLWYKVKFGLKKDDSAVVVAAPVEEVPSQEANNVANFQSA